MSSPDPKRAQSRFDLKLAQAPYVLTTCEAAKQLGRKYLGFELKKEYVELGKKLYGLNVKL